MSALDSVSEAALQVVTGIAAGKGVSLEPEVAVKLAGELIQSGVELLDQGAKKHAEAAGDAAADAIETEDEAESLQRTK